MDRVCFTTHRGKEILLVDLTNCSAEDVIELLSEVQRIVTAEARNSVLTLATSLAHRSAALRSPA